MNFLDPQILQGGDITEPNMKENPIVFLIAFSLSTNKTLRFVLLMSIYFIIISIHFIISYDFPAYD